LDFVNLGQSIYPDKVDGVDNGVGYGIHVTGIKVPNSGHWIPEERPDFVIKLLDNFFGSNITKSSKMSTIT
jgi:pimeloyl-ACP methyl ester carboxylesterase